LVGRGGRSSSGPSPPVGLYLTRVYYSGDDWSAADTDEILS
jgi:hypothetical protein